MAARRPSRSGRPTVAIVKCGQFPENAHVLRNAMALVDAGYEVHVVCLQRPGQPRREQVDGIEVYRLPLRRSRGSSTRYLFDYGEFTTLAALTLLGIHARRHLSVVEIDNMPDALALAAVIPRLSGARLIHYVMDSMPELWMHLHAAAEDDLAVRMLAGLERAAAGFADHVIVTQELARRSIVDRGVAPDKVSVVLNTADEAIFDGTVRSRFPREPFRIVTHGTILVRYGIHVLCDALPALLDRIPDATVEVFGEGEYRRALEGRARRLGVADRFRLRGFVPQPVLLDAIRAAHVGYVGMLNNLSLPNKFMEYLALEIPVVVARWPLFEHYFPDSTVGYFRAGDPADLARAIIEIHERWDVAERRAAAAKALWDAEYSWRQQRPRYLAVYERLCPPTRCGPGGPP